MKPRVVNVVFQKNNGVTHFCERVVEVFVKKKTNIDTTLLVK